MNQLAEPQPEAYSLRWVSASLSVTGHLRKANEDALLDAREQRLWAVADGMGGHSKGDRASQAVIRHLLNFNSQADAEASVLDLRDRLLEANTTCRQLASGDVSGSTVAALYAHQDSCYLLWAGDSRIYRLRGENLEQLSQDHSLVQELCRLGELTPEEAENHPSSNVITRAVGVHEQLELDILHTLVMPGDRFLLCSDGLFKDVSGDEVQKKLALPSVDQALRELVQQALDKGGTDNITAIVIQASF